MIKVSVIIPVYNVEPYLDETMQSLIGQTLKEIEIIAVNDGSTDKSAAILEKYSKQDSRISYYNQENQGQSAARNQALRHAEGKYIYFMDADDVLDLEALKTCYEYAEKNRADFAFFDGDMLLEENASELTWNYKRTHLLKENTPYQGKDLLNLLLDKRKHSCVVWLLFVKKSYLDRINLYFLEGIIHEDELFTTLLTLQSQRIFCLQRSFVKHRVRRSSTMGIRYSQRNINCYLTVFDELFIFQDSPITRKFAHYTLSKVFYTGHIIPFKEKLQVFWRAVRSGYLRYIGIKSTLVFWLK